MCANHWTTGYMCWVIGHTHILKRLSPGWIGSSSSKELYIVGEGTRRNKLSDLRDNV